MTSAILWSVVILIIVYFTISYLLRKYAGTVEGYWVMGRSANWYMLAGTLSATYVSMWTFVAGVGLSWAWGFIPTMLFYTSSITFGWITASILIGLRLRKLKVTSLSEFFTRRFGYNHMLVSSLTLAITASMFFYLLIQFQGLGIIFSTLSGVPYEVTIWTSVFIVFVAILLSGMWSVVVTDTLTFTLFIILMFTLLPVTVMSVGGLEAGIGAANAAGLWSALGASKKSMLYFAGQIVGWLALIGGSPHIMNRALVVKNPKDVPKGIAFGYVLVIALTLMIFLSSVMLRASIPSLKDIGLKSIDAISPYAASHILPLWLGILIMVGAVAAAFTTANTMGLTGAEALVDIIRLRGPSTSSAEERRIIRITWLACLAFFLVAGIVAYSRPWIMAIASSMAGIYCALGIFPTFVLTVIWRRVTAKAVMLLLYISIIFGTFMVVTYYFLRWFSPFPALYAFPLGFLLLTILTLITKPTPEEVKRTNEIFEELSRPEKWEISKGDHTVMLCVAVIAIIVLLILVKTIFLI